MAFAGYLIKLGGSSGNELPMTYMKPESYVAEPNQRMESEAARAVTGLLHRTTVSHTATKIEFETPIMRNSDIVALKMNGNVTFHYVGIVGFRQIDGFLPDNPLKNAEMSMEDDCGMIDGIINNGKNPALEQEKEDMVAKKPQPLPLREQMKRAMEKHQATPPSVPHPAKKRKVEQSL